MMRRILGLLIVLVLLLLATMIWARSAKRPSNLGVSGGRLTPCPSTPNCVETRAEDPDQRMDPIPYEGDIEEAQEHLLAVIRSMERTTIVESEPGYIWAEFRTPGFGFIDDVEFQFDEDEEVIHFRSASRLGYSDLGVNRKRMEALRARLAGATP
jgi:uncharacterized protein (DUF1499 family)